MTLLYLVTPPIEDSARFLPAMIEALEAAPVASLWLRIAGTDDRNRQKIARPLIGIAQERGVAVLVDSPDYRFAAHVQADGLHLPFDAAHLEDALESLQPERVVGVGGLRLKDNAMLAGESNADYLMFGEPNAEGEVPALTAVVERCRWWAEIFNTPGVGYAPDMDAVAPIAQTGIEFVALGEWCFAGPIAGTIRAAAKAAG